MKIKEINGKFSIVDFDEIEAYMIACKIERDGIRFYSKLSERSQDPVAKETLEFLLSEEKRHFKLFDDALGILRNSREIQEDNDLLQSMDFGIFEPYASMDELETIVTDIKKALRLGIVIENKSIALYQACVNALQASGAGEAGKELECIIDEEKKHKALLENLLQKA
ncbi:MAG: ferritin family protein [Candidatus Omnitrophota bacterium]